MELGAASASAYYPRGNYEMAVRLLKIPGGERVNMRHGWVLALPDPYSSIHGQPHFTTVMGV